MTLPSIERISVLGSGSWGTALAIQLARNGHHVTLWGRNLQQIAEMSTQRRNLRYLPDTLLPENLTPVANLNEALNRADSVLIAVPSHAFRETLESIRELSTKDCLNYCWATKGLEQGKANLLHQVFRDVMGEECRGAVISGPTFAGEVAKGLPTAVTVAAESETLSNHISGLLHGHGLRCYTSTDMISVEIGGACKNVLAIAAGIADGLGFGANTRAALITRGLAELVRLGLAMGGRQETLMGLSGLGDLLLTCTDNQSRNRRLGLGLGKGGEIDEVIANIGQAVEGYKNAPEVVRLAERMQIEMPITEQVYQVLYKGLSPQQAVENLLQREAKAELH